VLCDNQLLIIDIVTTPIVCPVLVNGDWQELSNLETSPAHNASTGDRQTAPRRM
jgi:hypothetical protein